MADARERPGGKFERAIGIILRAGVVSAAVIVLAGGILYLHDYAFTAPHYHAFSESAVYSRSVSGIAENALRFNSYGIIQLGLLMLIATPVIRVVFSVVAFALQRDLTYVAATLVVLAVLLYSLFGHGLR